MRVLIEGVTKIRGLGDNSDDFLYGLGILTFAQRAVGSTMWVDGNGNVYGVNLDSGEDIWWEFVDEDVVDNKESAMYIKEATKSEWTDKHYDHYYTLTPEDIAAGKIKIDPYFVNTIWGINDADKTGAAFHNLKTLSRMAKNKNSLAREWDAMIGQSTRARQLMKGE